MQDWKNKFPKENRIFETSNGILYHADCREQLKLIPSDSIDLIIIDPPYLTTKEKWDTVEIVNENLSRQLHKIGSTQSSLYVWCGIGEKSQSLIRWFPIFAKHWYFKDLITWKKQRGYGNRKGWLYTREEIMWFVKSKNQFIWRQEFQYSNEKSNFVLGKGAWATKTGYKRIPNVWTDVKENYFGTRLTTISVKHYTPKPLEALIRIIKVHTDKNSIVLDAFCGSGSTAIACEKLNRKWIGIEINKEFCQIVQQRFQNLS